MRTWNIFIPNIKKLRCFSYQRHLSIYWACRNHTATYMIDHHHTDPIFFCVFRAYKRPRRLKRQGHWWMPLPWLPCAVFSWEICFLIISGAICFSGAAGGNMNQPRFTTTSASTSPSRTSPMPALAPPVRATKSSREKVWFLLLALGECRNVVETFWKHARFPVK